MTISIHENQAQMAAAAAARAGAVLREALDGRKAVTLVAATGNAQLLFLDALALQERIDWSRVTLFHLDEYVGLPATHGASFAGYIQSRIVDRFRPGRAVLIQGTAADVEAERQRVSRLVSAAAIDVAFVGIGENGHLAFNDPPADFQTQQPYLVVDLDERCRRQQVGEGWYRSIDEVPKQAFSMSIRQIMQARSIIAIVPEKRKAEAVRDCLSDGAEVTPLHPASILRRHPNAVVFLDRDSASLLPK